MGTETIARGKVERLCVNGEEVREVNFWWEGPAGDRHAKQTRRLSGHDGAYIRTSSLEKGDPVFNWRTWTGLSAEELREVEQELGLSIPVGCLLENIVISGIPDFSKLAPTTRLVFPCRGTSFEGKQAIFAIWEENGPCKTVGGRLADHYQDDYLKTRLIVAAQNKRGVMGFVLAPGIIKRGDEVLVYPPVR